MSFQGDFGDRLALRDLLDTYADAVTRCDAQDWGQCWAEDSEWSLPDFPQLGTIRGKAAIVATWVEAMKHFPGIVFQAWPGAMQVDGDTAVVRSYTCEVYDRDGVTKQDRGRYDDVCVKIAGRWYFKSRTFRSLHRA
jgi:ketosteroid isomerase-like protein